MNSLSWLIYLAEVSGGVAATFGVVAFFSGGVAVGSLIFWLVTDETPKICSWEDKESKIAGHRARRATLKAAIRPAVICFIVCSLVSSFLPSRDTIYAIAASEMGEEVVKSETAGKAMKALNAWLDRQIAPEAPAD